MKNMNKLIAAIGLCAMSGFAFAAQAAETSNIDDCHKVTAQTAEVTASVQGQEIITSKTDQPDPTLTNTFDLFHDIAYLFDE